MPSICLRLSALMNAPGRLQRRRDGLKEVKLDSEQMCLIPGICITLLLCTLWPDRKLFFTTHRFLSVQTIQPQPSGIGLTRTGVETCTGVDFQGYLSVKTAVLPLSKTVGGENKFSLCYYQNFSWVGIKGHQCFFKLDHNRTTSSPRWLSLSSHLSPPLRSARPRHGSAAAGGRLGCWESRGGHVRRDGQYDAASRTGGL